MAYPLAAAMLAWLLVGLRFARGPTARCATTGLGRRRQGPPRRNSRGVTPQEIRKSKYETMKRKIPKFKRPEDNDSVALAALSFVLSSGLFRISCSDFGFSSSE